MLRVTSGGCYHQPEEENRRKWRGCQRDAMDRKFTARQHLDLRKRKSHMTRAWVSEQRDSVSRGAEMICTNRALLPVRSSRYPARNTQKWS